MARKASCFCKVARGLKVIGLRWDRMMRSKSFDAQEVREIGRKEAEQPRGFPIL